MTAVAVRPKKEGLRLNYMLLKEIRRSKGITQKECAKNCEVSLVTYQLWEDGIITPAWGKTITPEDFAESLSRLSMTKEEIESILVAKSQ